ncbi:MAG: hypothetical protein KA257_00780 [Opitutaceae bacterium]|nr:hypothetical protein [Opitutaceae bacterium]MBP9912282.1 hypothetical protein [Opitutaceae bacterium]
MASEPEGQPVLPKNKAHLAHYFTQLHTAFTQARSRTGFAEDRVCVLAGRQIRLRFASPTLVPVLTQALAHLPPAPFHQGLDILCWDETSTGVALPVPPWSQPAQWRQGTMFCPFGVHSVQVSFLSDTGDLVIFSPDLDQAIFWVRDAQSLPSHHLGAPLLTLFSSWAMTHDLMLVHAGCVGDERSAVLLVGKGGAGKSTTSLLCADAGLSYLSDDYCLVQNAPQPVAFALYCSGKLERSRLPEFPRLTTLAVDPAADPLSKPVLFLNREAGYAVTRQLPLRAIIVPVITGQPHTTIEPTSAAQALLALAPSTLFQLPNAGPGSFQSLARLARSLPCYRLNLGTKLAAIPPAIRSLLASLS